MERTPGSKSADTDSRSGQNVTLEIVVCKKTVHKHCSLVGKVVSHRIPIDTILNLLYKHTGIKQLSI